MPLKEQEEPLRDASTLVRVNGGGWIYDEQGE
jgi:hypothetical protein